ncbi:MAG: diguanylate cyclase [Lachnospiraceae bacterium]|nr:diguanylate cyclase [Lachnospiraceae bacterium]
MDLHSALLNIQYLCIIVLFLECWIVLKRWKYPIHGYLFFSCVATLVNSLGYLLELKAQTEEAYITALQLSYAGRMWIALALLIFVAELCRTGIPDILTGLLVLFHVCIYAVILTLTKHDLYYTNTRFVLEDGFPVFYHENGPVHQLLMILQIFYIVMGFAILIHTYRKERRKLVKKRLCIVIAAVFAESFFFVVQTLGVFRMYDVTMPGFLISSVLMYVAIFRFDLLGTRDIAREFMIDRLSEGIIAVDNEGEIQYFNDPAKQLFPELEADPDEVIKRVRNAISRGEPITVDDSIYTPEENDLLYKGESFGRLYVLTDSTEHYKRLKKEKKILRKELLTDPISGFYNRKGMEYYSEKMYEEAKRSGKALFVCVADMNGLKRINDNYGHESGDRALEELSKIVRDSLESGDMAFRTGGDEFLIIGRRDTTENVTEDFSRRMESIIRKHNDELDLPYSIDMSYGTLVRHVSGSKDELQELIKEADAIMYEMKKHRDPYRR